MITNGRSPQGHGDSAASTLRRGVAILELLTRGGLVPARGIGPSEIARHIGCDKSTASRTLNVLADLGLVERSHDSSGYRATWALFGLGMRAANSELVRLCAPVLRRLTSQIGESSYLTVLDGKSVLVVWSESPPGEVAARPGSHWTVHASATGKALLSDSTRTEICAVLADDDLERFTPVTPVTVSEFIAAVDECRRRGFATSDAEWDPELVAVAVPVRGPFRETVASIAVSGGADRVRPQLESIASLLVQASSYLTGLMRAELQAHKGEETIPRWLRRL